MRASSRKLAMALAERIGKIVPAPFTLRSLGSGVDLYVGEEQIGGSDAAIIIEDKDGRTASERVKTVVLAVLGDIQDSVMLYLTEQWPTEIGGELAMPGARTDAGRVYLWYGASEEQPVISLRPIKFDDFQL